MSPKIAVIGLGNMGAPMAGNLVKAGYEVRGFDPSPAALEGAASRGIKTYLSANEAVTGADVIITMLPSGKLVLKVWQDIQRDVGREALVIDCSTIDVASAREAHAIFAQTALTLDAPVSGGTVGAEAASLTFMVGGHPLALERAEPILAAMGRRIVPCGEAGNGQAAKICNNMILGISMSAVCEAFVLADKLGLSHQALFDVASTSSGQCWALNSNCPVPGPVPSSPANRDYKPGFAAELMSKDLELAIAAGASTGAPLELGEKAAALYRQILADGAMGKDFSSLYKWLSQKS